MMYYQVRNFSSLKVLQTYLKLGIFKIKAVVFLKPLYTYTCANLSL